MGADFLLYTAPIPADRTEAGIGALVASVPADRLAGICEAAGYFTDDDDDENGGGVHGEALVDLVVDELTELLCEARRDVTEHRGEIVTGGMSWGDWPTDAAQQVLLLAAITEAAATRP